MSDVSACDAANRTMTDAITTTSHRSVRTVSSSTRCTLVIHTTCDVPHATPSMERRRVDGYGAQRNHATCCVANQMYARLRWSEKKRKTRRNEREGNGSTKRGTQGGRKEEARKKEPKTRRKYETTLTRSPWSGPKRSGAPPARTGRSTAPRRAR